MNDKKNIFYYIKIEKILSEYRNKYGDEIWNSFFINKNDDQNEIDIKQGNISNQIEHYEIKKSNIKQFIKLFFNTPFYLTYWSRSDKSGFAIACENEWKQYICKKKTGGYCNNCQNIKFKNISEEIIFNHLNNENKISIFSLDENNSSRFLIIKFDYKNWQKDILEFKFFLKKMNLNSYIEILNNGSEANLWMFFESKKSSNMIKTFIQLILYEMLDYNSLFNFEIFSKLIPSKNNVSNWLLGDVILLPYSKYELNNNSSYFIDDENNYLNINDFVNKVEIIKNIDFDKFKDKHKKDIENIWNGDNFQIEYNGTIEILKGSELIFNLENLSSSISKYLRLKSSIKNPEFVKKIRMRMSTYNVPFIIFCSRVENNNIYIPRGLEKEILNKFKTSDISFRLINNFNKTNKIDVKDNITLNSDQEISFQDLLKYDNAILDAKTGFGKTVLAMKLISKLKVRTLILVHNTTLARQWYNSILKFLNIDENRISFNKKEYKDINVRTIQSYLREENINDDTKTINLLLIDECHHYASPAYENIIKRINSKYVYGFTATAKRSDSLYKILDFVIGPTIKAKQSANIIKRKVIVKTTDFNVVSNDKLDLLIYNEALSSDSIRNKLIANTAIEFEKQNKVILIIVEWVKHLEFIQKELENNNLNVIILHAQQDIKNKKINFEKLSTKGPKIIIATGAYIGEGFDVPDIDTLIIGFPFKWSGKLEQYIGRMRENDLKDELTIVDFLDKDVLYYYKMFIHRLSTYKKFGYEIQNNNNFNQMVFDIKVAKDYINSEILSSNTQIISSINFNKLVKLKIELQNKNILYIDNNEIEFLIIDNNIVWIFSSSKMCIRIQNEYLVKELSK